MPLTTEASKIFVVGRMNRYFDDAFATVEFLLEHQVTKINLCMVSLVYQFENKTLKGSRRINKHMRASRELNKWEIMRCVGKIRVLYSLNIIGIGRAKLEIEFYKTEYL